MFLGAFDTAHSLATRLRLRVGCEREQDGMGWWHEKKALHIVDCFCFVLFVQRISPPPPPPPSNHPPLVMQKFRHFKKVYAGRMQKERYESVRQWAKYAMLKSEKKETHCGKSRMCCEALICHRVETKQKGIP